MSVMWLAVPLSLGGGFLVASDMASRRRIGFYVWTVSNSMWIWDALRHTNWPMLALFAIYMLQCVMGIRNNRSTEVNKGQGGK